MADRIELPVYYEDQVLGAADLNAAVDLSTGQLARHERYLHTWGIAAGLKLQGEDKTTAANKPYIDVTCSAGVAIDGWGREIVVAEDELLNPSSFEQSNVFVQDAFHPVFLAAVDESASSQSPTMGSCFTAQVSRLQQSFTIRFGRPGTQLDVDDQDAATFLDGPGDGGWDILLGYVKYDTAIKKFTEVTDSTEGIGPRYAGVQADEVVARSGKVVVRTNPASIAGKPALALDSTSDKALVFGLQDGAGGITELLSVDSKGNLKAAGAIGTVLVSESGLISAGMLVPLPEGVAEETVAQGQVRLQIHVTPFFTQGPPDPTQTQDDWVIYPRECRVDDRRVHCRFTWVRIDTVGSREDHPGVCRYTVIAYTPKE
jgi:hypothetical protein